MGIRNRANGAGERGGRVYDPVFIFMVLAMVLAVISSIALRTVVSGMGPSAARAAASGSDGTTENEGLPALGTGHGRAGGK